MSVKLTVDLFDRIGEVVDDISTKTKKSKSAVVSDFVELAIQNNLIFPISEREAYPIRDLVQLPPIDLNKLKYDINKPKSAFRTNFFNLDFRYRALIFKWLYHLTNGINSSINKREMFLGTAQNANIYYTSYENGVKTGGKLCFYLSIKGYFGKEENKKEIAEQLSNWRVQFRPSTEEPDSPIWISKFERFLAQNLITNEGLNFYNEILSCLGIDPKFEAVQLSEDDLKKICDYFSSIMPIKATMDEKFNNAVEAGATVKNRSVGWDMKSIWELHQNNEISDDDLEKTLVKNNWLEFYRKIVQNPRV